MGSLVSVSSATPIVNPGTVAGAVVGTYCNIVEEGFLCDALSAAQDVPSALARTVAELYSQWQGNPMTLCHLMAFRYPAGIIRGYPQSSDVLFSWHPCPLESCAAGTGFSVVLVWLRMRKEETHLRAPR